MQYGFQLGFFSAFSFIRLQSGVSRKVVVVVVVGSPLNVILLSYAVPCTLARHTVATPSPAASILHAKPHESSEIKCSLCLYKTSHMLLSTTQCVHWIKAWDAPCLKCVIQLSHYLFNYCAWWNESDSNSELLLQNAVHVIIAAF